jgi:hypothetical protein
MGARKIAVVVARSYDPFGQAPFGRRRNGVQLRAVQRPTRVNVRCVTPLGEEVASTS